MPFNGGFTFANFLADVLTVFLFVAWFWLLISVFRDLFRRRDLSGWMKTLWVLVVIVAPYLGVFIYLITQGRGMADRNLQEVQYGREELKRMVGFSVADELEKLERLKSSGAITSEEYARLRARLVE
ncbi:MAG TPA: SHOCT domain-containing protein [Anaeromyxobacter sp.]|nr:SHOCT domain-containing protein [Anaeromyxobacter sp.]